MLPNDDEPNDDEPNDDEPNEPVEPTVEVEPVVGVEAVVEFKPANDEDEKEDVVELELGNGLLGLARGFASGLAKGLEAKGLGDKGFAKEDVLPKPAKVETGVCAVGAGCEMGGAKLGTVGTGLASLFSSVTLVLALLSGVRFGLEPKGFKVCVPNGFMV